MNEILIRRPAKRHSFSMSRFQGEYAWRLQGELVAIVSNDIHFLAPMYLERGETISLKLGSESAIRCEVEWVGLSLDGRFRTICSPVSGEVPPIPIEFEKESFEFSEVSVQWECRAVPETVQVLEFGNKRIRLLSGSTGGPRGALRFGPSRELVARTEWTQPLGDSYAIECTLANRNEFFWDLGTERDRVSKDTVRPISLRCQFALLLFLSTHGLFLNS